MSADVDVDRLRRAAKILREHADAATQGEWEDMPMGSEGSTVIVPGNHQHGRRVARTGDYADAAYIALMHPPVARVMANLLDTAARHGVHRADSTLKEACQIADLILGGRSW